MGNVQSSTAHSNRNGISKARSSAPLPQLDFDNMPFLKPPSNDQNISIYTSGQRSLKSPYSSISPHSPVSVHTEWNQGIAKQPSYHDRLERSPNLSMKGEISMVNADDNSLGARSPSSSQSGSSITSQLSLLSQVCPQEGYPRSHSPRRFKSISGNSRSSHCSSSNDEINANVPPEVPPHLVLPSSSKPTDAETETALAAIEALEFEIEEDERNCKGRRRTVSEGTPVIETRPRSKSRARSLSMTRVPSRVSLNSDSDFLLTTDVYTRKCYSPEVPSLVKTDTVDDHSEAESEGPATPGNSPFALDGYNDGTTKLRVVNYDSSPQRPAYSLPSAVTYESEKARKHEKYRVKSKAQLAEEEEELQRRRYARYGHIFKGTSAYRI